VSWRLRVDLWRPIAVDDNASLLLNSPATVFVQDSLNDALFVSTEDGQGFVEQAGALLLQLRWPRFMQASQGWHPLFGQAEIGFGFLGQKPMKQR
jgi:hypothetical protein